MTTKSSSSVKTAKSSHIFMLTALQDFKLL